MTSKSHPTRCATLAIAATLALGSTPLLAQDVAAPPAGAAPPPTIVIPNVAPPPPPAPTIVIPQELTQPQPQAAPQPQTPPRATTRATAPQTRAAPRPAPVAAAPAPDAPVETTTEVTPIEAPVAAAPLPAPIAQPELAVSDETTTATTTTTDNTLLIALGAIGALALLLLGFFAFRRKGPKRHAAAAPTIEKPVIRREPLADLPAATAAPEFPAGLEPEKIAEPAREPSVSYSGTAFGAAKPAASLSHSGASVPLPRELPASFEERDALVKRMVEAQPDRANPFRSYRARLKRARLILQSLGRDFKNADPWIDFSQYPSNWPELARRQSAAA